MEDENKRCVAPVVAVRQRSAALHLCTPMGALAVIGD